MKKTPAWDLLTLTVCRIDPAETRFNWFPGNLSEEDGKSLEQNGNPHTFTAAGGSG